MPAYLFNAGPPMPSDGDYDAGDTLRRAVAHPCLPFVPLREASLDTDEDGIAGNYDRPPRIVLASALASQWVVNASLSAGGVPYSCTDQIFDVSGVADLTIGNRSQFNYAAYYASLSDQQFTDDDWVQLIINAGRANRIKWATGGGGMWVPGIEIVVISRKFDAPDHFSSYGWNSNGYDTSATAAAASVTVCGEVVSLYQSSSGTSFTLEGTITLEPSQWLEPF